MKYPDPMAMWLRFKEKNLDGFPRRNWYGTVKYKYPEDRTPNIFKK